MEQSNKEKNIRKLEQGANAIRDMVLGFIPGMHVIDGFLNFRSNLKKRRLQDFGEDVKRVFQNELKFDLTNYNFETEDFVDVLESILIKVTQTKSELKLNRFRNILVNQIINPVDNLLINDYIHLINELNDIQIIILDRIPKVDERENSGLNDNILLMNIGKMGASEVRSAQINGFELQINNERIFLNSSNYKYYINDLVSKGLLERRQTGTSTVISPFGGKQMEHVYLLTKTAIELMEFVKLYNPEAK